MKKSTYVRPLVEVTKLAEDIITASGTKSLKENIAGSSGSVSLGTISATEIN